MDILQFIQRTTIKQGSTRYLPGAVLLARLRFASRDQRLELEVSSL